MVARVPSHAPIMDDTGLDQTKKKAWANSQVIPMCCMKTSLWWR